MNTMRDRFLQAKNDECYQDFSHVGALRTEKTTPESPWYGKTCASDKCPVKTLRAGDQVICCPSPHCTKVFHQDHHHQLLCWSLHYCGDNVGCPAPQCKYQFYTQKLVMELLGQTCQEDSCDQPAKHVIPLAEETLTYHHLCDRHREKYLFRFYQQELFHILRQSGQEEGIPLTLGALAPCAGCSKEISSSQKYAQCPHCNAVFHYDQQSQSMCLHTIECPECKQSMENRPIESCRAKKISYWQHDGECSLVPFPQGKRLFFVSLCPTCRDVLDFFDQNCYLREQFYRGYFLGAYPKAYAIGEVPLHYYRDLEDPPNHSKNDECIYCHTRLRQNDRVVACPKCKTVYHEDIFSHLLCWAAHFSPKRRDGLCANPHCRYRIPVVEN